MKKWFSKIQNCLPKLEGFSLSWPPSINFSFPKKKGSSNLSRFEELIEKSSWRKEYINNRAIWICEENDLYQINISPQAQDFHEEWTSIYPDKKAFSESVWLKIGETIIKEVRFISCDGGRIFVPLPKIITNHYSNKPRYEWNRKSLDFKLAKIIGRYYIYETIEGIAKISNIQIIS